MRNSVLNVIKIFHARRFITWSSQKYVLIGKQSFLYMYIKIILFMIGIKFTYCVSLSYIVNNITLICMKIELYILLYIYIKYA